MKSDLKRTSISLNLNPCVYLRLDIRHVFPKICVKVAFFVPMGYFMQQYYAILYLYYVRKLIDLYKNDTNVKWIMFDFKLNDVFFLLNSYLNEYLLSITI